jgi:excisionase family DNA binding protein
MDYDENKVIREWMCEDMVNRDRLEPMLNIKEVAQLLHVHSNTIRRWADQGLIITHRINRRGDRRFRREDVADFIARLKENTDNKRAA